MFPQVLSEPLPEPASNENDPSHSPAASTAASPAPKRVRADSPTSAQPGEASVDSIEPQSAPTAQDAQLPGWQPAIVEQPGPDAATPHSTADPGMISAEPPQAGAAQAASTQQQPTPVVDEQSKAVAEARVTAAEDLQAGAAKLASMQQPSKPSPAHHEQSQAAGEQPHSAAEARVTAAEGPRASAAQTVSMQQLSKPSQIWDDSRQGPAEAQQAAAAAQAAFGADQHEVASKQAHTSRPGGSAAARAGKAAEDRESGEIESDRSRRAGYDSQSDDVTLPDWAAATPGESLAMRLQSIVTISEFEPIQLPTALERGSVSGAFGCFYSVAAH